MDYINAINNRVSRRSYLNSEISEENVLYLVRKINDLNKESDLRISFINNASTAFKNTTTSYGMFKNVKSVILLKGKKDDVHLYEKIGYYGELLVLEATALQLGTCWVGGTYSKDSFLSYVNDDEELVCIVVVGNVNEHLGIKEKMISKLVHRKSKTIEDIYEGDAIEDKELENALTSVLKAPSTLNKQDILIKNINNRITIETTRFEPSAYIDLGIAKLHFELMAHGSFELGNKAIYKKRLF